MKIAHLSKTNFKKVVKQAVSALKNGGLVIYPTETCYGLGADALNSKAIDKVFAFKGNRKNKPISIAVSSKKMARKYVKINQTAENIYANFLPGPITVVSQSLGKVNSRLESWQKTLGIRIPAFSFTLELIKAFKKPITSTSANISGGRIPYSINNILPQLSAKKKQLIDLIIDAGKLPYHRPSSIVDTVINEPTLLRQGEIKFNQVGIKNVITNSPEETRQFAQQLLKEKEPILKEKNLLFALQGELGSGKTEFAKGIGKGLGINRQITSPTFVIVKEYPYQLNKVKGIFYHLDAWRLAENKQSLGFIKDYFQTNNVVVIEWIQKDKETLNSLAKRKNIKIIWLEIIYLGLNKRKIKLI